MSLICLVDDIQGAGVKADECLYKDPQRKLYFERKKIKDDPMLGREGQRNSSEAISPTLHRLSITHQGTVFRARTTA